MQHKNFLLEIGCEELPAKTLLQLSLALSANITAALTCNKLQYKSAQNFATPRRLAVIINELATAQPNHSQSKKGPAVAAAFTPNGEPTPAALGFAKSCGVQVADLEKTATDKGEWLVFCQESSGIATEKLLPAIVAKSIQQLPINKKMRWGSGKAAFARPVHWCVLLFGGQVLDGNILGVATGNKSRGHRFHSPDSITIASADDYLPKLRRAKVMADFSQRKLHIKNSATALAQSAAGVAYIEDELLDEITALNEWPMPILGDFPEEFLQLPQEVLISTMQSNQKYLPIKNLDGQLLPNFITFANIDSTDPSLIQRGNERVIAPRFADAQFFWQQDTRLPLAEYVPRLDDIIFQQQLGTMGDKTKRLEQLSCHIAAEMGADATLAKRAAHLAKADLCTDMVGEFAALQGVMGRYYATNSGEAAAVATAIEQQYLPKHAGDKTASSAIGQIVSIADKTDTLAGIFSVRLAPTGDKDPYALRRAALGILRTIIENKLPLDIVRLLDFGLTQLPHNFAKDEILQTTTAFVFERLKGYCLGADYTADEFAAVMASATTAPSDFMHRMQAVREFRRLPEAQSLIAANKRIANILKKSPSINASIGTLTDKHEIHLLQQGQEIIARTDLLLAKQDYLPALTCLATLKTPIDDFFANVMVNTDDAKLRASRLALLQSLAVQFCRVADIAKLQ